MKKVLIVDFCNYEDYPIGGYLSFVKNLMESFGDELALVGITTDVDDPIGHWFKKLINGSLYDFFAIARYDKLKTKHVVPDRLVFFLLIKFYKKRILKIDIKNIFIQRPEAILSLVDKNAQNICFCFAGLENPLSISKYKYVGSFANLFEKYFFKKLKYVKTILASGDEDAINEMILRSDGKILSGSVKKFPTRINIDIYKPLNKVEVRKTLNMSADTTIIITTGRLALLKGWRFMIDCFFLFQKKIPDSLFYFIGEGEDLRDIQDYITLKNLDEKVILAGKMKSDEIAQFLNAADLFIMGSFKEGWSTSLSESIACGIPSCVTKFSSANEIIQDGNNGYVIENRNTNLFVERMFDAIKLSKPVYNENVKALASNKLKDDFLKVWNLQ